MQVLVIMVLDPAMTGLKTNSIVHGPPYYPMNDPMPEGSQTPSDEEDEATPAESERDTVRSGGD